MTIFLIARDALIPKMPFSCFYVFFWSLTGPTRLGGLELA